MSDLWYWDRGRIISLAIACGYIILAFFTAGAYDWLPVLGFAVLVLACIWFRNETRVQVCKKPEDSNAEGFLQTYGWPMDKLLHSDFTLAERVV